MFFFDVRKEEFIFYEIFDSLNLLEGLMFYYLIFDKDGDFWMGIDVGVLKMNFKIGDIERFFIDNESGEG